MALASDIREHMEVLDSEGVHAGTVDGVEGERIKLQRKDSADGVHHYVPLSAVARVDEHVHLNATRSALGIAAMGAATTGATTMGATTSTPVQTHTDTTEDTTRSWLPWVAAAIGLILLFLLLRSCMDRDEPVAVAPAEPVAQTGAATPALPVEAVALPNGTSLDLEPQSLNYELQRYLASATPAPRTFTFDKLNFDSGSAAVRAADQPNVDALAQILAAYPNARVRVVGYTDARGSGASNANLGADRAKAVAGALAAKGVAADRVATQSGGETNPTETNTTAQGQFENRRTELVVTAK